MPRKVGSKTVGRGEARPFPDKDEAEAGSEMKPDRIADGHPALLHQREWSYSPRRTDKLREKACEQGNGVALDRQSGQAIGDDDGQIAPAGVKLRNGVGVERPAKDRLAQIRSSVGRVGLKLQDGNGGFTEDRQFGMEAVSEGGKMKGSMYRVPRLSMCELEVEHLRRGDAMAGSSQ